MDPKIPGNYRGIAVTPVLGKILESIIKDHIEPTLTKVQNPIQRGFTAKTSPINAAVVTTGDKRSQGQRQVDLHNYLRCRKSIRQARP